MQIFEALSLLGLSIRDRNNKEVIRAAWKKKIYDAHPDRNSSSNTLKVAQALNEAKDILLGESESEIDKFLREKREEALAKKKADEQSQAVHHEYMRKREELDAKERELKRERYNKNRKKRAPESRVHRKIENYPEGKALIEEMRSFFKENFVSKPGSQKIVFVCDILDQFRKLREKDMSDLEKHLFQRHSKQILSFYYPDALYSRFKNKRGFQCIEMKS